MPSTSTVFPDQPVWEGDGTHRIPFVAYTSEDIYKKELERFFYQAHWCYIGLEAEVPMPGDFKRTVIGERSVILARDADGQLNGSVTLPGVLGQLPMSSTAHRPKVSPGALAF